MLRNIVGALTLTLAVGYLAPAKEAANCECEVQTPAPTPTLQGAHDPCIAKQGGYYYVFMTGVGIPFIRSRDRANWEQLGPVFKEPPKWTGETIPGNRGHFWAPDVSFFDGKWHLYYSVSTFGRNHSAIGLATNKTLDPTSKDYAWKNEGAVVVSQTTDNYNAIDPNAIVVGKTPYLALGSFWSGIKLFKLDSSGTKLAEPKPVDLARRPDDPADAIEAPFLFHRGGYFYLFPSYDLCCRGVRSSYNIRVGRSKKIEGPYVDRDGKSMLEGGGTRLIPATDRWKGPGHCAVLQDKHEDWLVFHAYDAERNGAPTLQIRKLNWSKDDWPEPTL
jgi:arabinan endo-1,5-alpha-L-arabinosidase